MITTRLASAVLAAVLLAGCQSAQNNPKQTIGTLMGAGLGALAGSQVGGGKGQLAAVAVGALAGAWMGSEIGKSLDAADRAAMQTTTQDALETRRDGEASTWRNPNSGNSGSTTPLQTFQTAQGNDCRTFENTVAVDGRTEHVQGQACRQPDGSWKVVE